MIPATSNGIHIPIEYSTFCREMSYLFISYYNEQKV